MTAIYMAGLRVLLVKRIATVLVAACMAVTMIVLLVKLDPSPRLPDLSKIPGIPTTWGLDRPPVEMCSSLKNRTEDASARWRAAQEKYSDLMEDKFTIAMHTYKQPEEIDHVLRNLLSDNIPSLYEIVVVWNDLEEDPPGDFKSEHGVFVRYRKSPINSLNQKYVPDADFKTKAILLSDSDVYYKPDDLEFVFQTWRSFGQYRLTGALARCAAPNQHGKWEYKLCSKDAGQDVYSMIITNLSFSHISFLDYYSSEDDPIMTKVRKYVDDHNACESIAMNYMASYLTGHGQLLVQGHEKFVDLDAKESNSTTASQKISQQDTKTKCLNDFNEMFGCMPLVNETAHIEPGVILL